MKEKSTLKGVFLIAAGASSYGMLATCVKIAYKENFTTAEITLAQFILGILGVFIVSLFQRNNNSPKPTIKNKKQLMLAGTSLGFTSVLYYLTLKYIPVSIAIIMLMQTVWISVVLEAFLEKKMPELKKIIAVFIVLLGTVLATNVLQTEVNPDWRGIVLGLLSSLSFTTTMFTANRIATNIASAKRTLYLLSGGIVVTIVFALITQVTPFNFAIFGKWGILLALFGTIIPPLLMTQGFPLTGIGLGSIVSSLELPISVSMAYFLLNEKVVFLQWTGILCIIFAIVMMNIRLNKK